MDPLTLDEVEAVAKAKLPKNTYEFYASGSDNQEALGQNQDAFRRLFIQPRVLRDVSTVDTTADLFGWRSPVPIGIAPSAMQKLAGAEGEYDTARAAASVGVNMTLSSQSTVSLENVMQAREDGTSRTTACPPFWMQIYLYGDMEKSVDLIRRAEAAGYQALCLTVDTPVLGNRLSERRTPVVLPQGMALENLVKPTPGAKSLPSVNRQLMNAKTVQEAQNLVASMGSTLHSSSLTWQRTIDFLRCTTKMKIILKGIMTAEDAALAVQHGVDGIIVSNHGGRQLDSTCATIEALPAIVAAVKGVIPVILDGGIRSGTDVFKALALGASFIHIGRPVLWGLAYNGREGVETVLNILERELSRTMALAGVTRISEISRDSLGVRSGNGFGVAKL